MITRVGHLDCPSGVAGDMLLGALVDAGASLERMQAAVDALDTEPIRLKRAEVRRAGLRATHVTVTAPSSSARRRLADIAALLEATDLDVEVRAHAHAVFARLAMAEARVHGVPVEKVHFHEVGALDAIADVVATCAGLATLGLARLTCGPIATGIVTTPAVPDLLRGLAVYGVEEQSELVTPTGAALVATLAEPVATLPAMTLQVHGVGAGSRDLSVANVVRLLIGMPGGAPRRTRARLVEATVDDLSPEHVPAVLDRLRLAGAHDAWATPVLMKKGRPGFTLTALTDVGAEAVVADVLFRDAGTLGVRTHNIDKRVLHRDALTVEVDGHEVRVKIGRIGGEVITVAPEFDDVARVAEILGRPARTVHEEAAAAARARLGQGRGA